MKQRFILGALFLAIFTLASLLKGSAEPRTVTSQGRDGRYQIFFSPFARADAYLVDTQTGKIWKEFVYSDIKGDPQVWKNVVRIDSDTEFYDWLGKQTFKEKQEAK